jgi:hypothetical protein
MKQTEHNEQIIDRLLKLWYSLIGGDHHKDRDCWFFIEREYCTYEKPSWSVRHYGYILGDYTEAFETFEKAQEGLIELIAEACAKEIDSIRNNHDEYSPEKNAEYCDNKLKELEKIITDQHYISEKV